MVTNCADGSTDSNFSSISYSDRRVTWVKGHVENETVVALDLGDQHGSIGTDYNSG